MPDVVTVEPAPASEPAEPAPASEPAAEPADDSDEAPSPSQSFKRTTSAMTEPIPEEVMRMRGSIQAPSYEEWSEAKKLAEGEDSDDVAVDEGRDVVGRPPASRRDWIKDLLIKDMIEDWWKKNEQERMNSKMTSAAESSMSSAD